MWKCYQPGECPSKGLLRDCEIFVNIRLKLGSIVCSGGHSPLAQVLVGYTKLLPNFQDTIWTWCFIELGIWHLRIPVLSFSTGSPTTFITRLSSITENVDFITTLSCYFGTFSIKINPLKSWRWRGKAVRQIVRKIFFHWIFSLVFFLSPPLLHCMYGLDILIFLQKSFCIVCLSIYLCLLFHQNGTVFLQNGDCDWFIIDVCLALALSAADSEVSSAVFMFSWQRHLC